MKKRSFGREWGKLYFLSIPESLSGEVGDNYGWEYSVFLEKTSCEEDEEYVERSRKALPEMIKAVLFAWGFLV